MIKSILFWNQTIHGSNFAHGTPVAYLHGNVGDKCKAVITIETRLEATGDSNYTWTISSSKDRITRTTGSFFEDGFFPGQIVNFHDYDGGQDFNAKLTYVDDFFVEFVKINGNVVTGTYTNPRLIVTSDITGLVYRYGFVENDAAASYQSLFNGITHEWKGMGLAPVSTKSLSFSGVTGAHKDGSVTVKYVSNNSGVHTFEVTHYFTINPIYLQEYADDISDGLAPELFAGSNSLKYVFESEFRFDYNNPNNILKENFERYKGTVGWYNEGFNGNLSSYSIGTVTFYDTRKAKYIDGINVDTRTKITIPITGSLPASAYYTACIFTTRKASYYQKEQLEFKDAFLYDTLQTSGGDNGTGIIKRITVSGATVEVFVEYTDNQADTIDFENEGFIVLLSIADKTKAVSNTDKVTLLVANESYANSGDIAGLLTWNSAVVYAHNDTTNAKTSYRGWPQDGVRVKWEAELDTTKQATLESLRYEVVAMNADEEMFTIGSFPIDLGNPSVDSNGVQRFDIASTRGFNLASDDPFNEVSVETITTSPFVIRGIAGVKIPWQDWIKNPDVDPVFVDTTKTNDNLNKLTSNYEANGFNLYLAIVAGVSKDGRPETEYAKLIELDAFEYGDDGQSPVEWTTALSIRDSSGNALGVIDTKRVNNILFTFTPASGSTTDYSNIVAVVRLEKANQPGEDVHEFSSLRATYSGNPLQAVSGQTYLKMTTNAGTVTAECDLDGRKLAPGSYNLTARLYHGWSVAITPVFTLDTIVNNADGTFDIPVTAKSNGATPMPDGAPVNIRLHDGTADVEIVTGYISADISNFNSDINAADSIVSFASGTVTDAGTLVFDKLAWAIQNSKTNQNAVQLTLYSKSKYRGVDSTQDSCVIPISNLAGKGDPIDVEMFDGYPVFADNGKGVRSFRNDYSIAFSWTDLVGDLIGITRIAVDDTRIYGIKEDTKVYLWDSTNRKDLGYSGTPLTTFTAPWNIGSVYVNKDKVNTGYADIWIGQKNGTGLYLLTKNGIAWQVVDLSSKISGISANLYVRSVVTDSNDDAYVLCDNSGGGTTVVKLAVSGTYYAAASWTASTYLSNPGAGTADGPSGTARMSGDTKKIIIFGYDGTINATSGTNPMLMVADYGNDAYRVVLKTVTVDVTTPAYCGTIGDANWSFGGPSDFESGEVTGMCWDNGVLYGTGTLLFSLEINNPGNPGDSVQLLNGVGYQEATAF